MDSQIIEHPGIAQFLSDTPVQESRVADAAHTLTLLSNPQRLRVLCHLIHEGELSVAQLLQRIQLSPSALSQHLAKLREDEFVSTRKERQNVFYRVNRDDIRQIIQLLQALYCPEKADLEPTSDLAMAK